MSQPIPPPQFAVLTQNGYLTSPWYLYLAQFSQQPGPIAAVIPTGSPFTYRASGAGTLNIAGGTVSDVTFTRAGMTISVGTSRTVAMVNNDAVTITYSVAPSLNFVPT